MYLWLNIISEEKLNLLPNLIWSANRGQNSQNDCGAFLLLPHDAKVRQFVYYLFLMEHLLVFPDWRWYSWSQLLWTSFPMLPLTLLYIIVRWTKKRQQTWDWLRTRSMFQKKLNVDCPEKEFWNFWHIPDVFYPDSLRKWDLGSHTEYPDFLRVRFQLLHLCQFQTNLFGLWKKSRGLADK